MLREASGTIVLAGEQAKEVQLLAGRGLIKAGDSVALGSSAMISVGLYRGS